MPFLTMLIKPASSLCNMRCKYCFYCDEAKNRTIPSHGIMSRGTSEAVVKRAYEYAEGVCNFIFQGGEPTLAGLEYFEYFVALCKKYNAKNVKTTFSIQTNGYNVSEEMAVFFAKNGFLAGLSLDGYADVHNALRCNSFNKVMQTARLFDRVGVKYNILSVITGYSARHGAKIYNFFKKNGFKYLQFIPQIDGFGEKYDFSLTPQKYADFLKSTFDLYYNDFMSGDYVSIRNFDNYVRILDGQPAECCGMNGECCCNFTVESDGSVYPCDFYALDKLNIGNIHDNSLEEMKNSDVASEFIESSKYIDPKCRECEYFSLCLGGCRRLREPFEKGVPSLNRFCESWREFFPYAYERMVKMLGRLR